ncbi:DUF2970 domain-containing protein [Zooshikella sp. WH53]|uniref:DUF2970 domain-containing protein n=2 Tax=Zooshikella harenae TaxID=2827238 RepID=A0ABS5ZAY3_9GAMM|nr:DUF2970 domain-containing protein [Zooshikella harenae]
MKATENPNSSNSSKKPEADSLNKDKPISFLGVLQSVFAAAFGVQSQKKRRKDFSKGKPIHYVLVGILFTTVFILIMVGLVQIALNAL